MLHAFSSLQCVDAMHQMMLGLDVLERPILTSFDAWHRRIEDWKKRGAFRFNVNEEVMRSQHMLDHLQGMEDQVILPQMTIDMLYELTQGDAIVTTGVGQHQMWAGQWYKYDEPRRYITSALVIYRRGSSYLYHCPAHIWC